MVTHSPKLSSTIRTVWNRATTLARVTGRSYILLFENDRPLLKLNLDLLLLHFVVGALAYFIAARVASAVIALFKTST